MIKNNKLNKYLSSILPSLIAVFLALLVGAIIMMIKGVNPIFAYASMAKSAFYQSSPKSPTMSGLAKTLMFSTPLIYSALAAMVGFKAGLFNIGAQGQMIAGGIGATLLGVFVHNYIFGNFFVALIVAAIFGFLFAGFVGILKAKFNVSEVISTIMLNYIIYEFQTYLLNGPLRDFSVSNPQSARVFVGARLPLFFTNITKQNLNLGFVIAILLAIGLHYFFKSTKLGYEIKAVGYNITSSENAGINPKFIIFIAMGISGAIAGLGGAERLLGGATQYAYTEPIMGDYGFTGLAVALLGKNNPFGIIIASIFYAALEIGGQTLQLKYQLDKEIIYIIQALIIIFVAAEQVFNYFIKRKEG